LIFSFQSTDIYSGGEHGKCKYIQLGENEIGGCGGDGDDDKCEVSAVGGGWRTGVEEIEPKDDLGLTEWRRRKTLTHKEGEERSAEGGAG